MEFVYAATGEFSASHEEEACFIGPRLHGHRWQVIAHTQARFDPIKKRLTSGGLAFKVDLHAVLDELDGRHLNDMLPGTQTAPENLAVWVLERLSLEHKHIFEVTVRVEGHEVRVTREVRA